MCLAIPSKVIEINDLLATVDVQGAQREASLMLMPEDVAVGEYVLVHAGFAIQKVDEEAALDALRLINEMIAEMEAQGIELDEDDSDSYQRAPSMPPIKLD
jgi:hydrogenase expression/formation protein HypC